jgi:hypothetical protein
MAKPLLCRLRLHRWDDREKPETHDRYQVCVAVTHIATGAVQHQAQAQLGSPVQASPDRRR